MLLFILMIVFGAVLGIFIGIAPFETIDRPKLQPLLKQDNLEKEKRNNFFGLFRQIALINRPLTIGPLGKRISRDLSVGRVNVTAEEFFLLKELCMVLILFLTFPMIQPDMMFFWVGAGFAGGYMLPEFWLQKKVKKVKSTIIKELPDVVDLLGLCVNAGLDFMLALKWVIEKSRPTVLIDELNLIMQEINVGKSRRTALTDLSKRYEMPDLSTFARTLIQADRMGTSVAEALNILSEDMRLSRYRRGEQIALKAPLKMLIPLLLFIFPVVGVLVAAPVFLDFMNNNPLTSIAGGTGR